MASSEDVPNWEHRDDNDDADADLHARIGTGVMVTVQFIDDPPGQAPATVYDQEKAMADVHDQIQKFYDEGKPLFPRRLLRELVRDLDWFEGHPQPGQGVMIEGLHGRAFWFPVYTGKEYHHPMFGKKYKCVRYGLDNGGLRGYTHP
jgi:hypothetical protein